MDIKKDSNIGLYKEEIEKNKYLNNIEEEVKEYKVKNIIEIVIFSICISALSNFAGIVVMLCLMWGINKFSKGIVLYRKLKKENLNGRKTVLVGLLILGIVYIPIILFIIFLIILISLVPIL